MIRSPLVVLLVLALSACGFQLRDALSLPPDLGPVRVVASDPYSPIAQSLTNSLQRAGATIAPANAAPGTVSTLRVLSELWDSLPIAVDEHGRAQEFSLRYAVVFELEGAGGRMLVPRQVIELTRDYVSLPENSTGTESEREILSREMQREMTSSILRRIDTASRTMARTADGKGADAPLQAAPEGGTDTP